MLDPGTLRSDQPAADDTRRDVRLTVPAQQRASDPLIGRLINGRYRILSSIARGGMGKVYRAEQAALGRPIAIKVLTPGYGGENDPEFHKRFFREASVAAKLKHPNSVTIFDHGCTEDGVFYIAMELLEGRTLQRVLRDDGSLSAERAVHIAGQICAALREAHGLGVVHRDLKPANVFIVKHGDENEFAKVLDFGLVKDTLEQSDQLTHTGMFLGSPRYMSPEQIQAQTIDPRVDIYALGVMMFEMLTGSVPFDSANTVEILMAHVHEPVPVMRVRNPGVRVPAALEHLVRRCMAKNPLDRFESMNEVLAALKQWETLGASPSLRDAALPLETSEEPRAGLFSRADTPAEALPAQSAPRQLFAQAASSRGRLGPLLLLMGCIAVSVAAMLALGPGRPGATTGAAPSARGRGAQPATQAAAPAPDGPSVIISLRSTPPGAMVVVGDREYGPTPVEVEWRGPDAQPGRQLTFRFRRTGYRAVLVTREIRGPELEVQASFRDVQPAGAAAPVR
jgi:serine/threonine-protein kinase